MGRHVEAAGTNQYQRRAGPKCAVAVAMTSGPFPMAHGQIRIPHTGGKHGPLQEGLKRGFQSEQILTPGASLALRQQTIAYGFKKNIRVRAACLEPAMKAA